MISQGEENKVEKKKFKLSPHAPAWEPSTSEVESVVGPLNFTISPTVSDQISFSTATRSREKGMMREIERRMMRETEREILSEPISFSTATCSRESKPMTLLISPRSSRKGMMREIRSEPTSFSIPAPVSDPIGSPMASLDLSTMKPARGGVIISTVVNGVRYFGFGVDWKTGEVTDFGGGIYYGNGVGRRRCRRWIDKNAIDGCLREFKEESLSVFPEITAVELKRATVLHTEKMMILIVPLDVCLVSVCRKFNRLMAMRTHHEIRDICWLSEPLLRHKLACNTRTVMYPFKLYSKVRTLFNKTLMVAYFFAASCS